MKQRKIRRVRRHPKPRPHQDIPREKPSGQPPFEPRISRRLVPVLTSVGIPEASPFVPDPFQVEAVETLEHTDVVVSAPTGSGKTWIAEQAIRRALEAGQRAWYASPLKALSNAKLAEFGEIFGRENVGILTGDRKENTNAPLIVGTTEILRNQLYDAMYRGQDLNAGLVVLDEAHYLGDPERGVVWEEVIIYLPVRVRLLLLSATVENADQLSRWLTFVRDEPCTTVKSDERPVPLFPLFLFPTGELAPLKTQKGSLSKSISHFLEREGKERGRGPLVHLPPFGRILRALDFADLLPAIFFLKSRSDCDSALSHVAGADISVPPEMRRRMQAELDAYISAYPFLAEHPQLAYLRQEHVASHHAGHLPHWKLLVERLMQRGLLRAIFSTSTVAAGVNFPARTVVITQSDRFNGREFVDLSATDLLQMTGRAGRRGMDNIGFACIVPGPFQNVPLVASLLNSLPEPIESQISINFSMVLNLLLSHRPAEVKQMLGMSLATFQRLEVVEGGPRKNAGPHKSLKQLAVKLTGSLCPGPEEAVIRRRRRRQLEALRGRLARQIDTITARDGLWSALSRGRVFMDMFGSLAAVLRRDGEGDSSGVLAVGLTPDRRLMRGKPRLDFVPLDEIAGVFQEVLDLPFSGGGRALAQSVLDQVPDNPAPLAVPDLERLGRREAVEIEERLSEVDQELSGLTCLDCPLGGECLDEDGELRAMLDRAEGVLKQVQEESHAFWYDFVRHLEFLRSEGFVDAMGRLTQDGMWASKLRLDQPVSIAEAIRKGALPEEDPVLLAALVALFVDDRERDAESRYLSERLKKGILSLRGVLDPIHDRQRQWGFSTPLMPYQASQAVFAWGLDTEFGEVVHLYGGAEGDLAALIYRTADNLRQIVTLHETHPRLADCAREAVDLLLRPPVVVPT